MKHRELSTLTLALLVGWLATSPSTAAEPPPAVTEHQAAPETDRRPAAPPPGMMVTPATPPQAETGVPGCPARNLKPLELLV